MSRRNIFAGVLVLCLIIGLAISQDWRWLVIDQVKGLLKLSGRPVAEKHLWAVVKAHPEDKELLRGLAEMLGPSTKGYEKAIKLNPADPVLRWGWTYWYLQKSCDWVKERLSEEDKAKVIKALEKCRELEPENAIYDYVLAYLHFPKDMPEVSRLKKDEFEISFLGEPEVKGVKAEKVLKDYFEVHGLPLRALEMVRSANKKRYRNEHLKDIYKAKIKLRAYLGHVDITWKMSTVGVILFSQLAPVRRMAQNLVAVAWEYGRRGEHQKAIETLEMITVMGEQQKEGAVRLMEYVVGQSVQGIGYRTLRDYCIENGFKEKAFWAVRKYDELLRNKTRQNRALYEGFRTFVKLLSRASLLTGLTKMPLGQFLVILFFFCLFAGGGFLLARKNGQSGGDLPVVWGWLNTLILFLLSLVPALLIPLMPYVDFLMRGALSVTEEVPFFGWEFSFLPPRIYFYVLGGPLGLVMFGSFYYFLKSREAIGMIRRRLIYLFSIIVAISVLVCLLWHWQVMAKDSSILVFCVALGLLAIFVLLIIGVIRKVRGMPREEKLAEVSKIRWLGVYFKSLRGLLAIGLVFLLLVYVVLMPLTLKARADLEKVFEQIIENEVKFYKLASHEASLTDSAFAKYIIHATRYNGWHG